MNLLDLDTWQEIAQTLRANPMRTLLTALGVFWGMLMLLLMLGFGDGLEGATFKAVGRSATNAVFLWGSRTSLPYAGRQPGRYVGFRDGDAAALEQLPGLEILAPRNQLGGYRDGTIVRRGPHTGNAQIMGDEPQFAEVQRVVFDAGRFLNPLDLQERRKVAVIGRLVHEVLFPDGEDPVGYTIEINGVPFQVVGLFHSPNADDSGDRADNTIHVPRTTFQHAFHARDRVGWFTAVAAADKSATELQGDIEKVLKERHGVHPDDTEAIGSFNAEREFRRIQNLFAGIRGLVWFVGSATLLSGVVGVSNIMLIVVRERTSEIGLRRALGATRRGIVTQVVTEALVLTVLAGQAGIVVGVLLLQAASAAIGPNHESLGQPTVELEAALLAFTVLTIAGMFAGLLPARRAASIHPVAALRAE